MTDLLASIEGGALATWTRESPSLWAYPTILTLHTFGLAVLVGASAVIDFRLLGVAPRIPVPSLRQVFPVMWWAFALNFATGVLLFMANATTKGAQWVFYVKLALIALATIVMWAMAKRVDRAGESADDAVAPSLRPLAVLSLVLWTGAIIAGRLLAYL